MKANANASNTLLNSETREAKWQRPAPTKPTSPSSIPAIVEIKDTLKDLKELLLSNAVLSEQVSHFKENITSIDIRLRKLELDVAQGKGANRWVERVVWCLTSAALGYYLKGSV